MLKTETETVVRGLMMRGATGSVLPLTATLMGVRTALAVRQEALSAQVAQMTTQEVTAL